MTREEQIKKQADIYTDDASNYAELSDDGWSDTNDIELVEKAFIEGAKWADKNPNPQNIAEYLYKEKGYPISLNGEIPTFEETMKAVQAYNAYKEKQLIEKACNWLREQKEMIGISFQEDFIERFKIAMEE